MACAFMPEFFVSVLESKPNLPAELDGAESADWKLFPVESLYLRCSIAMEKSLPLKEISKTSTEFIIKNLRSIRDHQIDELLKSEDSLTSFLERHYNTFVISAVKQEFLKRDLIELKNTSLDLVHYASLIKEIMETGNLLLVEEHPLFTHELKVIFQRYGF